MARTLTRLAAATLLGACGAAAAAAEGFDVETLGGEVVGAERLSLDAGRLTLWGPGGERTLPFDEVLFVTARPERRAAADAGSGASSGAAVPSAPRAAPGLLAADGMPADLLVLVPPDGGRAPGDRLWGRIVGGSEYGVQFRVEEAAAFEVPFERIERLLPRVSRPVDRLALLEGDELDDRVWRVLPNGALDGVTGVVARLDAEAVVVESSLGEIAFRYDEVLGVVFGATDTSRAAVAGRPVLVRLAGGTRLDAGLLGLGSDRIELSTRFAERLVLPLASLASLVHTAGGVVPLASLEPAAVEEWPSIGAAGDVLFPWRRDLSVSGAMLALAGVPRATGLGVHANARLVYDVPEGAAMLRATVGLLDEVAALPAEGSVRFEVLVDGEIAAATGVVREGDAPVVLRADLAGARRVAIVTTDAGDHDAGDRAGWVDAVLLPGSSQP